MTDDVKEFLWAIFVYSFAIFAVVGSGLFAVLLFALGLKLLIGV